MGVSLQAKKISIILSKKEITNRVHTLFGVSVEKKLPANNVNEIINRSLRLKKPEIFRAMASRVTLAVSEKTLGLESSGFID